MFWKYGYTNENRYALPQILENVCRFWRGGEQEVPRLVMSALKEIIPAVTSGSAAVVVGHPLDCVKVRMQTALHRQSTTQCVRMMAVEGPQSFYRGMTAPLANAVLMNTIMFVGFAEVDIISICS